ncbi:hypothetical protein RRG08_029374 [Elysia crispata]|uniref:Uncharacterized protein n=1 Tax=Elysia crispata TaxID=231223 RepID=A0AAE1B7A1_9GAST|nr:hypothetical protein RRG08_029374 [Elysia crispata]
MRQSNPARLMTYCGIPLIPAEIPSASLNKTFFKFADVSDRPRESHGRVTDYLHGSVVETAPNPISQILN